ncbi:MAG TPA: hypothetical protein VEY92_05835 [Pseudoxanthomonas sp.]|nr:hypothetical protein [Pseudoxanthomonas sp.]
MKTSVTTYKKKPSALQKKVAAKKAALRPFTSAAKRLTAPPGYTRNTTGKVLIPVKHNKSASGVVPASKLQNGISKAREQISGVLQELLEATRDGYEVSEIELSASFNADGKFLGFGIGGEMSITFKVRPINEA